MSSTANTQIIKPSLTNEEAKMYQVYDVYKFQHLQSQGPKVTSSLLIEGDILLDRKARPQWGIDSMLIDEELLYLDDKEADRVYQELKLKSERRREMELRQNRLSSQMSLDEESIKRFGSIDSKPMMDAFS